jgi:hypothetical protein
MIFVKPELVKQSQGGGRPAPAMLCDQAVKSQVSINVEIADPTSLSLPTFPSNFFWYFMTYEVPVYHSLWFELQVGDQSRLMQVRLI